MGTQLQYGHCRRAVFPGKKERGAILKTENLWTLPRGQGDVPALRGVNFESAAGRIRAVMGPSAVENLAPCYVIGGLAQRPVGRS